MVVFAPSRRAAWIAAATLTALATAPALAQTRDDSGAPDQGREGGTKRVRVTAGAQLRPRYPGADGVVLRPYIDVARAREGEEFPFEAPDQSFGLALLRSGDFVVGPSLGLQGRRARGDTDGLLPKVPFTVELGGFAQYQLTDTLRLRVEARQGVNGHDGFISVLSADYVLRDGDRRVFSIGPRLTLTDAKYQRAYFGVDRADAGPDLPAFDPGGGVQSVGAAAGYLMQLSRHWGLSSFVKYDRLVDDPGRSPVVDRFGSRDQISGGIAVTYTFGGGL